MKNFFKILMISTLMVSPLAIASTDASMIELGEPLYLSVFGLMLLLFGGLRVSNKS